MSDRARVTSIEAIEDFRSSLIVFLTKARPALDEVADDVLRTRVWLQGEQRLHWEHVVRRKNIELEEAQQALFSASIAKLRSVTAAEQMAVHHAKRALVQAEEKLKQVKRWDRDFGSRVEPLAKQLEQLRHFLAIDMAKAVTHLAQVIKTLSDYTDMAPPAMDAPATPTETKPAAETESPTPPATGEPGAAV
ncbi:MAG: hypothetical protein WCO56_18765 [Verrucomicrobiota bacterium]